MLLFLFVCTLNASCISLTKSLKEKPPLIIEMNTDEHLGTFSEYGISKDMVNVVFSHLDIVSAFTLTMTNRSFYCLLNSQLDWVKFYYYTTVCCTMNSGGKKTNKQLLVKILSLSFMKQDHIWFPRISGSCHQYLVATPLRNKLTLDWQQSSFSFSHENIESTLCPFGDIKSQCSVYNLMKEELLFCSKIMKNRLEYVGQHKHFKILNVKIPILYVFEHVNNSHDELIFFFKNCSFQHCDVFSELLSSEISLKNRADTMYFCLTNVEGDKCCICLEFSKPLIAQCHILGILSKKKTQEYKLKNLFYLPSISFSKD